MGLFGVKHKDLDLVVKRMQANLENNYKDNAQDNLKEFIERFEALQQAGKLSQKQVAYYSDVMEEYKGKLKGYSHKDQTPYWT